MNTEQIANDAIEAVLRTQWEDVLAVRIDSPPGAGKTGVAERLAVQAMALMDERCMVATQTNEQAFDLIRRLTTGFPRLEFALLARDTLPLPADVIAARSRNLRVVHDARLLPEEPSVVVSNAAKWSWVPEGTEPFDVMIVDEAFQLPDYRFHQIANLARRIVLIGDPGQIDPVITAETERWRDDLAGPHVPAPRALVHRHPGVLRLALPLSRRLVPDTVRVVQPAFYPDLPFAAFSAEGARRLEAEPAEEGDGADDAIDLATDGASLVALELPPTTPGPDDPELAEAMVALIERLVDREASVVEDGEMRPLTASQVGVVCAHVVQVHAVRERLPDHLQDVLVETADRFQGLEREVMVVHHPLSGRADVSEFHLDAGRLCVMLSRHRTACFVVTRGGVERQLLEHGLRGDRVLGLDDDPEYRGWRAHLTVLEALRDRTLTW